MLGARRRCTGIGGPVENETQDRTQFVNITALPASTTMIDLLSDSDVIGAVETPALDGLRSPCPLWSTRDVEGRRNDSVLARTPLAVASFRL